VLEPPLLPTPAEPLPASPTTSEHEKVNASTMSVDSRHSGSSNYASSNETGETFCTSYSKYGIREKEKVKIEEKPTPTGDLDEETGRPLLGSAYQQCKSARAAAMFNHTVITADMSQEAGCRASTNIYPVGSLNCVGDTEVLRTFRGTRMSSNNVTVNQNISLSYDPATLQCIVCEKPHSILATGEGGAPPILIFSDQNFLPTLSKGCSCVAISRLEDGTLDELVELAAEILGRNQIPVGSLLLLGSANHLHNVGSSLYAINWCYSVEKISSLIRNVKTIPLTPILREDGPGSLGKQLIEISAWFEKVYLNNSLGVLPVWKKLVEILGKTDEDGLDLGFTDMYTVALPCSLSPGSMLVPFKFKVGSSHTTVRGLDSVASNELVRTLLDLLQCNFATVANSEELLSVEPASQIEGGKDISRLIICGGSNMSKIVPILSNMGYMVVDLTISGWTPTEKNILTLRESIQNLPEVPGTAVILDLLGNVAFRQAQLDGTLALPFKSGGKFHIEGKVHVCNNSSLSTIITSLKPVLDVLAEEFLFCSPIPRFLFNGCCSSPDHCVGTDDDVYVSSLLQETLALRNVCKSALQALGKKNAWVPDLVGNLLPACNGLKEKAVGLKHIMSADGVHFTKHGYEKLAETVVKCCKTQFEKSVSAASIVSARPAGTRQKTFYWRGFVSPVGSSRPASRTAAYLAAHPGGGGKWRNKPVNAGKNADQKQGGRNPPPYYRRN
jgi:hypothetical protein